MSAIWGAIDLSGKAIESKVQEKMKATFYWCAIDRYNEICVDNVYMGCGIQYFTSEAEKEELPCNDNKLFFDADIVLDNRKELSEKIGYMNHNMEEIPDGKIAFEMLKHYGKDSFNMMLGAYAFVYYSREENRLWLVMDAVGNRCLYYRKVGNILYYSSLISTLYVIDECCSLNKNWISDFLAYDSLLVDGNDADTTIREIKKVGVASYLEVCKETINEERYWNAFKYYKKRQHCTDEEYKRDFRSLFKTSSKCLLRSAEETGIMLSGGLDSTAVAAAVSPLLGKKSKQLFAYTSVPSTYSQVKNNSKHLYDESAQVKATAECLGNVECTYIGMEDNNIWEERQKLLEIMEMPYKSIQNMTWIYEIYKAARKKNVRILLSGEYGNTTASFTDISLYLNDLFYHGQWIKYYKELSEYCRRYHRKRRPVFKETLMNGVYVFCISAKDIIGKSYIKQDICKKYGVYRRMLTHGKMAARAKISDRGMRILMSETNGLRQIGEAHTKLSLATGVLMRDPMKDKRMIEFCMEIPLDQFQKNGDSRRLIRNYLADIMPKHILEEYRQGEQSSDFRKRITIEWNKIRTECEEKFKEYQSEFVDVERLLNSMNEIENNMSEKSDFDIYRVLYTVMMMEYVEIYK